MKININFTGFSKRSGPSQEAFPAFSHPPRKFPCARRKAERATFFPACLSAYFSRQIKCEQQKSLFALISRQCLALAGKTKHWIATTWAHLKQFRQRKIWMGFWLKIKTFWNITCLYIVCMYVVNSVLTILNFLVSMDFISRVDHLIWMIKL